MGRWDLTLAIDPESRHPLFLQIARAIGGEIRRGRLKPGDRLPGSRALGRSLGVHRNTALAAYEELISEGWIEARPGSGTYVCPDLSERIDGPIRSGVPEAPGYALRGPAPAPWRPPDPPGSLSLAGGRPSLSPELVAAIAGAWRRGVKRAGSALLDYGDPQGHRKLREALAGMLAATRAMVVEPEEILVTRGSQMALYLAACTLLRPGDRVAVESYGYPPAWAAFRSAGAELVPVPVDEREGMDVEAVAAIAPSLRAVYVTPHHQFPTMATLSPARRLRLLEIAAEHRLAVIEDDYDHEFHYTGRPVTPLASADRAGVVVYAGTFSKILAPGLRVGYAVAPRPVIERMVDRRVVIDRQGDLATELALAELITDGELQRHLWRSRRTYAERRAALAGALMTHLDGVVDFDLPAGGLALWGRVAPGISARDWARRARADGVFLAPGGDYDFHGRDVQRVRLGFGALDRDRLDEAVRRLARVLP